MPSFFRNRSPSPTALPLSALAQVKSVGFPLGSSPVTSVSRPLTTQEQWTLYHFEAHARTCTTCIDPHEVHRAGGRLCGKGYLLAQDVACIIYSEYHGREVYDVSLRQNGNPVKVELPYDYHEVRSLLKAMERSRRHRRQKPIVSFDRAHPTSARTNKPSRRLSYHESLPESREVALREKSPKRTASVSRPSRQPSPPSKQERRKSQVVEWPEEDLLALEARAAPTSWRGAIDLQDSPAPSTMHHPTKASKAIIAAARLSSNTRPVTPENRPALSRDASVSPSKAKSVRSALTSPARTPSLVRSKDSRSSSPARAKAARASTLAILESTTSPASETRPVSRDRPMSAKSLVPFAEVPAPEAASTRRRPRTAGVEDDRRASMYAGSPFKTQIREPKSRRWSGMSH